MTIAPLRPAPNPAAVNCARAAEATARCASVALGSSQCHDAGRCGEWCLLATRTLGACADLLGVTPYEPNVELMVAIARAGVIAAESCAVECDLQSADGPYADAAAACRAAVVGLRELIDELEPAMVSTNKVSTNKVSTNKVSTNKVSTNMVSTNTTALA